MNWLEQVKNYIQNLDIVFFKRCVIIFLSVVFLIFSFMIYRYYSNIGRLKKRIETINKNRHTVKEILERYEIVKVQQTEVDTLLSKNKDFKIGGEFEAIVKKLDLAQYATRQPETSSEELDNGYIEIKLYASFSGVTMQKITELLDILEQHNRIYLKEMEMYKPELGKTINTNLLIATLEPKSESTQPPE